MKRTILALVAILFIATQVAQAQTVIATMKTDKTTAVNITAVFSILGKTSNIKANGTTLENDVPADIMPDSDGKITLTTSGSVTLTHLFCNDNELTELDVTKATSLIALVCGRNKLIALDVSNCTALTTLVCDYNSLTALNVSANKDLKYLYCYNNNISSLDLSGSSRSVFEELMSDNNALTYLNLSGCTSEWLYVEAAGQRVEVAVADGATTFPNPVQYINPAGVVQSVQINGTAYAKNANVPYSVTGSDFTININENGSPFSGRIIDPNVIGYIQTPKVKGGNPKVNIKVGYTIQKPITGNITANGVSLASNLATDIEATADGLVILKKTGSARMTSLNCGNTKLTKLVLPAFTYPSFGMLSCGGNNLTALDVLACTDLTDLYCGDNNLTALDVSKCTKLTALHCYSNKLTELNLFGCIQLEELEADGQMISVTKTGSVYKNPIRYIAPAGLELIKINDTPCAYNTNLPVPATGNTLEFTTNGLSGTPFSGTITLAGIPTALADMATESVTVDGYYSIMGAKLIQEPTDGMYIIRYSNGKTEKVMKK